MTSVAILLPGHPIPRDHWNHRMEKVAKKIARAALEGVGVEGTDIVESGNITHVIRRLCSDDERAQVTEKYRRDPTR